MKNYLAINIQRLREFHNLSRWDVADELGVKDTCIMHYEQGKVDAKLSRLIGFSDLFGFPIDDLVRREIHPSEFKKEKLNILHIENTSKPRRRPVSNVYGTRAVIPSKKLKSQGNAVNQKVQNLFVLYEANFCNAMGIMESKVHNRQEEVIAMKDIRNPRRWQVLMQVLEYVGKVPLENEVTRSIISVSMAEQLASQLSGKHIGSPTTITALYKKKTHFVKADVRNAGMIPWKPGHGFEFESQRIGYFLKNNVKVKFTLQPYDPIIVSQAANSEHSEHSLPSVPGETSIHQDERKTVCPSSEGSNTGQGGEAG